MNQFKPILILGITDGDDGGASLMLDGKLLAAVNEERLNRLKMSIGFPRLAIREVLRLGNVQPRDIDYVAMASHTECSYTTSIPNKGWFDEQSPLVRLRNSVSSELARPLGGFRLAREGYRLLKRVMMGPRRMRVRHELFQLNVDAPIRYYDHHYCHAVAAYDASGYDQAISLSLDGGGDGSCSRIYRFEGAKEQLLHTLDSFHSIGNYYAYVTHICGFKASIHEGKITGLAARGTPRYLPLFRDWIEYQHPGNIVNKSQLFHHSAIKQLRRRLPSNWRHADLAASVQAHLEDVCVKYVKHWVRESGCGNVCLSGGVFANVRLNQKIAELPEVQRAFVFPAMGDGGLAVGAAYGQWRSSAPEDAFHDSDRYIPSVNLGTACSEAAAKAVLASGQTFYRRSDDVEREIAHALADGQVVARVNGPMEYGPRALGNRSILYRCDDPSVTDWLNARLKRTEFMPFAPACLAGFEQQLFDWNPAAASAARFMTMSLPCSDWMREHCPAVVHVDGTARPQIVDEETNPSFYRILRYYHQLTGVPVLINTSFNIHEEPIVCTPADAVRAFQRSQLDSLAIGPFLMGKMAELTVSGVANGMRRESA